MVQTETTTATLPTSVPVPQADDLDKVFEVVELVGAGKETSTDVAEALEMVNRQGFYYAAAAEMLGLIDRDETGHKLSLTTTGKAFLKTTGGERKSAMIRAVMRSPIIKYLASELKLSRPRWPVHAHLFEDTLFVQGAIEDLGFAEETALRRAYTVKAWMKSLWD